MASFPLPWPGRDPSPAQARPASPNPGPFSLAQPQLSSFLGWVATSLRPYIPSPPSPPWARIAAHGPPPPPASSSAVNIEERLAGVPVYALANAAEEFVLVSGPRSGKSLGLLCFRKEDADSMLEQMAAIDGGMRRGSRVVPVALNKVAQLKVNDVAFRFIPDSSQVANAIEVRKFEGISSDEGFPGVPVFESRSLVLRNENKRYRPVFFRKEDLDKSLHRAAREQSKLSPALRQGDIKVCTLEEIINAMKGGSPSEWDDVVFIPPGFDVSTRTSGVAKS